MGSAHGLFVQPFALTGLYCPNLVPLFLMGWQSPLYKLTIASEYFTGMKPLTTFRATINLISTRNKILLITPVVHILSRRRRSVLEQVRDKSATLKGSFRARKCDYRPHVRFLLYPFSNHFNLLPWPDLGLSVPSFLSLLQLYVVKLFNYLRKSPFTKVATVLQ
jgi:hypothetical protein